VVILSASSALDIARCCQHSMGATARPHDWTRCRQSLMEGTNFPSRSARRTPMGPDIMKVEDELTVSPPRNIEIAANMLRG
jgi:hypothetical protein